MNEGDVDDGGEANAGCVDACFLVVDVNITRKEENYPTQEEWLHYVEETFLKKMNFRFESLGCKKPYDKDQNAYWEDRLTDEGFEEGTPEPWFPLSQFRLPVSVGF